LKDNEIKKKIVYLKIIYLFILIKYKIVFNLVVYFLSLKRIYIYIYPFQNKKDFDGEDIAANLLSCIFPREMGTRWGCMLGGSKSYGFHVTSRMIDIFYFNLKNIKLEDISFHLKSELVP
jgi:hypothetical protein